MIRHIRRAIGKVTSRVTITVVLEVKFIIGTVTLDTVYVLWYGQEEPCVCVVHELIHAAAPRMMTMRFIQINLTKLHKNNILCFCFLK